MGPSPSQCDFVVKMPEPTMTFSLFASESELVQLQNLASDTLQCSSYVISSQIDRTQCKTENASPWDFGWPAGILELLSVLGHKLAGVQECGEQMEISQVEIKVYFLAVRYKKLTMVYQYSERERKNEAIMILLLCREILAFFANPLLIFYKKPLMSAPLLISFAAVYRSFSAIMTKLLPSDLIREQREQMNLLKKTVTIMRKNVIQERIDNIKLLHNFTKSYTHPKPSPWDTNELHISTSIRFSFFDFYARVSSEDTKCKCKRKRLYRWSDNYKYIEQYKSTLTLKYNTFFNVILNEFIPHIL